MSSFTREFHCVMMYDPHPSIWVYVSGQDGSLLCGQTTIGASSRSVTWGSGRLDHGEHRKLLIIRWLRLTPSWDAAVIYTILATASTTATYQADIQDFYFLSWSHNYVPSKVIIHFWVKNPFVLFACFRHLLSVFSFRFYEKLCLVSVKCILNAF